MGEHSIQFRNSFMKLKQFFRPSRTIRGPLIPMEEELVRLRISTTKKPKTSDLTIIM
jgi:hypothetical protein